MDTTYRINAVAARNQRIVNAYESCISQNLRSSDNIYELESQFNSQIDQLRETVNENMTDIANMTHSKYPQPYDPDYQHKRERYDALSQYACAIIDHMDNTFDNTFSRLKNLFHRLSAWIRNKATQVYTAVKSFFRGAKGFIRRWFP